MTYGSRTAIIVMAYDDTLANRTRLAFALELSNDGHRELLSIAEY